MHPAFSIKGSGRLKGKKIILGITGSIAAVRCVELVRSLIRRGADVHVVMSECAQEIIHPYSMHFASGKEPIVKLTGDVQHVSLMENADLLLIFPCTANTLGKIASGIQDTPVTVFASVALGKNLPLLVAPAMHEPMYTNFFIKEAVEKLKRAGVEFIDPVISEGSAKIAPLDEIVLMVERALSEKKMKGKKVIITSGPTREPIDPIRVLTNRSSGITGEEIAKEAYRQGASVTLVHSGKLGVRGIKEIHVETSKEMTEEVMKEISLFPYDFLISAAAISDFLVKKSKKKIPSGRERTLRLFPAPKMIEEVRKKFPQVKIVGFKAETDVTKKELIRRARSLLSPQVGIVVANDVGKGGIGEEENEVYIVRRKKVRKVKGKKEFIAREIIKELS
jgi:phosphopantothenoylcysteine decarboxylase/phosphopantothenate--cysteine ligase